MAEYDVFDSSGNHVGVFKEDGGDYDGEPSKPKRVYVRKKKYKLFSIISLIMIVAHLIAYFAGVFDPSDWLFTFGMLAYFVPSFVILIIVFFVTRRFVKAAELIENYIINGSLDKNDEEEHKENKPKETGVSFKVEVNQSGEYKVNKEDEEEDIITLQNTIKAEDLKRIVNENKDPKCEKLNNAINKALSMEEIDDKSMINLDTIVNSYLNNSKTFSWGYKLTYFIYVITICSLVLENINLSENSRLLVMFYPFNVLAIALFCISVYKSYVFFMGKIGVSSNRAIIQVCKVSVPVFALSIIFCTILNQTSFNVSNSIFIVTFALIDLALIINSSVINSKLKKGKCDFEAGLGKIPVGKLFLIETFLFIVFLGVICGLSLYIEPVYNALDAYDKGLSSDLSLPLTLWLISGGISLVIMTVVGVLVTKHHNKKLLNKEKEIKE